MLARFLILFVLVTTAQTGMGQSLTDRLDQVFGSATAASEILHPDEAFIYEADGSDANSITLLWQVEKGYYLYRDKFKFKVLDGPARIVQEQISIPAGKQKEDPAFGEVAINTGDFAITLPLQRLSNEQATLQLQLQYQGCKEDSVCYPPLTKELSLQVPAVSAAATAAGLSTNTATTAAPLSAQDAITSQLKDASLLLNILAFFSFGLLLSLTPCVFPMIPILSGIVVGQGAQITAARGFTLSLSYVLAMALSYALLGVIAGLFYINLQAAFQNPWIISLFSLVFVALALSMFGFYELQLPAALQSRLSAVSNKQSAGTLQGAAIMGALSAIIVGPCVAPPLAGALLYISQTGNALLGGLALFAMGLGFGVPLLIIGCSAGSLLPKAGQWMDAIKRVFGVIMLAVAIWFMERILSAQVSMLLWATLLIVSSIFLGAVDSLADKHAWRRLGKGLGIMMLVYGIILLIGAASGGSSIYQPLQGLRTAAVADTTQSLPAFKRIKNLQDLDRAIADASAQGKFVMLDFYADWCVVCKEMEEYTFSDPRVIPQLEGMVLLQADVTANDAEDRALLKAFDIYGPPAILFFGDDRRERLAFRLVGFVAAEAFIAHIQQATSS